MKHSWALFGIWWGKSFCMKHSKHRTENCTNFHPTSNIDVWEIVPSTHLQMLRTPTPDKPFNNNNTRSLEKDDPRNQRNTIMK
mmetsp:Transcript_11229/g.27004  ORF Transcript_11229/g.27004 Transcript_11229/m.27004 type:complete len:83 (-) Transcript_11229:1426-1674(-)